MKVFILHTTDRIAGQEVNLMTELTCLHRYNNYGIQTHTGFPLDHSLVLPRRSWRFAGVRHHSP